MKAWWKRFCILVRSNGLKESSALRKVFSLRHPLDVCPEADLSSMTFMSVLSFLFLRVFSTCASFDMRRPSKIFRYEMTVFMMKRWQSRENN